MRIPRPAQRRAILLQHRVEHAEARADHQLEECGFRVDQEVNERQGPDGGRCNSSDRTGYARLLHGGSFLAGLRPRLVTTRVPRAVRSRRSQISTVSGTSPAALQITVPTILAWASTRLAQAAWFPARHRRTDACSSRSTSAPCSSRDFLMRRKRSTTGFTRRGLKPVPSIIVS